MSGFTVTVAASCNDLLTHYYNQAIKNATFLWGCAAALKQADNEQAVVLRLSLGLEGVLSPLTHRHTGL